MNSIQPILDRVLAGERMTVEECTTLLESHDIARMGVAADEIRARRHPGNVVTYIIDRNINYTNVCNVVCTFCAFYRRPGAPDTYVRTFDEICQKIDETIALGGTGVLMQGGLHPDFGLEWYEDLLRSLRAKYPGFQLHCFSPPEIHNLHLITKLDYETIMARLKEAGLYSLPGGGAEILDDEVRKRVSTKCTTDEWLDVMRAVHRVGLRSTATMMFGIGDRLEHRVRHLQRIRDLQDETGGFTAFIPWTFQRENTALGRRIKDEPTGVDYLKMLAVSRLFLDNIENFQSSWLTQGLRLGQVALRYGANDMGSIMIEENVVSAAGAHNRADEQMLQFLIREAGFIPQQRDILYQHVIGTSGDAETGRRGDEEIRNTEMQGRVYLRLVPYLPSQSPRPGLPVPAFHLGAAPMRIELLRVFLFGHHATEIKNLQSNARIQIQHSNRFRNGRTHVLFAAYQDNRLDQTRKRATHVAIEIARHERGDRVLRSRLMTGGVKMGNESIGNATIVIKERATSVVANASFARHNVVERRAKNRRLQQSIKRGARHSGPPVHRVVPGGRVENHRVDQFRMFVRDAHGIRRPK